MSITMTTMLLAALLGAMPAHAQKAEADLAKTQLSGVWRGQMNNLPALTLVLTAEGGAQSGAFLFYLLKRENENHSYSVTPSLPEPILHPSFGGRTLTFEVIHRRAHPPDTLSDPLVTFEFRLVGKDKVQLVYQSESSLEPTLTRSDD
jgi:hypothetical protein